jgi:hypothetical protein
MHLADLFPRADVAAYEVGSQYGIADVVVAEALPAALARRRTSSLRPLSLPGALRLVVALNEELCLDRACRESGLRRPYGRRLLRELTQTGYVHDDNGLSRVDPAIAVAYSEVVAIEAKLDDWRRAVTQARRYLTYADHAYVALPAERVPRVAEPAFLSAGVGLIAVGETASYVVFAAATSCEKQGWRRLLVSEHLAALSYRTPAPTLAELGNATQ